MGIVFVVVEGIKLASDTVELEGESRQAYKNIMAGKKKSKVS